MEEKKIHVFLTGEKHVGKTTVILKYLQGKSLTLGGFRTVRTDAFQPGRWSVHLLPPGREESPSAENLLFFPGEGPAARITARFDRLGRQLLAKKEPCDLLLMDELGTKESAASIFQQAVLSALNGNTPILGVIQQTQIPFLQQIRNHPKVTVIQVTETNRDMLPSLLLEWFGSKSAASGKRTEI